MFLLHKCGPQHTQNGTDQENYKASSTGAGTQLKNTKKENLQKNTWVSNARDSSQIRFVQIN